MNKLVFPMLGLVAAGFSACASYHVVDAAYVDNKVYVVVAKQANRIEYYVAKCAADEGGSLKCSRVNVNVK